MKKFQKLILGIILVLLMIITLLIGINIGNKNTIQKQLEETQKLTTTSDENTYITTADHLTEVNASVAKLTEFKSAIANYIGEAGGVKPESTADTITFGNNIKNIVTEVTKNATATAEDITDGKTAWVNGKLITGNFNNNGGFFYQTYSSLPSSITFDFEPSVTAVFSQNPRGYGTIVDWKNKQATQSWSSSTGNYGINNEANGWGYSYLITNMNVLKLEGRTLYLNSHSGCGTIFAI